MRASLPSPPLPSTALFYNSSLMDERLLNHITSRLTQFRRSLPQVGFSLLDSHSHPLWRGGELSTATSQDFPVYYPNETLGTLRAHTDAPLSTAEAEPIVALTAQIAAIWRGPQPLALVLDQEMEALSQKFSHFDWCGIYRLEGSQLYLTAFRGPASPHQIIPLERGICGAAVTENATLNIPDVTQDPRYLACDARTRSELVVPIRNRRGEPIAEIDVDSHLPNAFGTKETQALEALADKLSQQWV